MSSFPTTVKTFTTKVAADTIQPAHVNDLQDEVAAIESGLINGTTTSLNVGFGTINLAGGQLTFPAVQSASSGANTLDDYEEGTWTPALTGLVSTSGQAYTVQQGKYLKIGKGVWVSFDVALSTLGTLSGQVVVSGLPFTVLSSTQVSCGTVTLAYFESMAVGWVSIVGHATVGGTTLQLYGTKSAVTSTVAVAPSDLGNNTRMIGHAYYVASA